MTLTCGHCGESFQREGDGRMPKYCSENCRKRAHEHRSRAVCVDCGTTLGVDSGRPSRNRKRCPSCHVRNLNEEHRARDEQIVQWWNEGLSLKEIAARLGCTVGHVAFDMNRARERGYDLPYRQRPTNPATDRRFKAAA